MNARFTDVCFLSDDVPRMANFYEALFEAKAQGDEMHCGLNIGGLNLIIDSASMVRDNPTFYYVSGKAADNIIISFEVDDVDAAYKRALSLGIETLNKPTTHPWGARSFQLRDVDGNVINLRGWPN